MVTLAKGIEVESHIARNVTSGRTEKLHFYLKVSLKRMLYKHIKEHQILVCTPVNVEDEGRRQNNMIRNDHEFLLKMILSSFLQVTEV